VAIQLLIEGQAVLLEGDEATIGGNAAQPGDVLHLASGGLDMDAGHGPEQVGVAFWCEFLHVFAAQ